MNGLNKKGFFFTSVEVCIVITIFALLLAIAIPRVLRAKERAEAIESGEYVEREVVRDNIRFYLDSKGTLDDGWIKFRVVTDRVTGKRYIIFTKDSDGITALEIKEN